jgi:hypothetical protein
VIALHERGPEDGRRFLPGVAKLDLQATIGPATAWPQQRMRKAFSEGHFPASVHCPNRCHNGGFELGFEVYDNVVKRGRVEHQGRIKCRGYEEIGRGRRQACNYTLEYKAKVAYGAAQL